MISTYGTYILIQLYFFSVEICIILSEFTKYFFYFLVLISLVLILVFKISSRFAETRPITNHLSESFHPDSFNLKKTSGRIFNDNLVMDVISIT